MTAAATGRHDSRGGVVAYVAVARAFRASLRAVTLLMAPFVALLGIDPVAHGAPPEPFALGARVPSSTLLFARVSSPRALLDALRSGPAARVAAPQAKAFVHEAADVIGATLDRAARGEVADDDFVYVPPLLARALLVSRHLEADVQVALVSVEDDGPRVALALDFGARISALRDALRTLEGDALDLGVRFRPRDGGGVLEIEGARAVRVTLRGSVVLATNDVALEPALLRDAPPASGALMDLSAFAAVTAPGTLAALVLDPVSFADQTPRLQPGRPARAWADAFGLAGTVVATYALVRADDAFVERVSIVAPGREARWPLLFSGKADPYALAARMPPRPWGQVALGWSPSMIVARVERLLRAADPDRLEQWNEDRAGWPDGLATATDRLLATLGDEIALWGAPSPGGGLVPEVALAVRTNDPVATAEAAIAAARAYAAGAASGGARLRSAPASTGRGGPRVTIHWLEHDGPTEAGVLDEPEELGAVSPARWRWASFPLLPLMRPTVAFCVVGGPGEGSLLVAAHPHGLRELVARIGDPAAAAAVRSADGAAGAVAVVALDLSEVVGRAYDTLVPSLQTWRPRAPAWARLVLDAPATRDVTPWLGTVTLSLVPGDDHVLGVVRAPLPIVGPAIVAGMTSLFASPRGGNAAAMASHPMHAPHRVGRDPGWVTTRAMDAVEAALREHQSLYGVMPRTLEALGDVGLLGVPAVDGWGHPLRLTLSSDRRSAQLTSAGPDGAWGTDDDRIVEVRASPK